MAVGVTEETADVSVCVSEETVDVVEDVTEEWMSLSMKYLL